MDKIVEFSVVIPCLNEEGTIADCIDKAFKAFGEMEISGEVVVVDNGSMDKSAEIARSNSARVITEKVPGYGSALKRGIKEAYGKYIIMGDGDSTYDFSKIDAFVKMLREGADLVMGSRLTGKVYPKAMPRLHRWVGTPVLTYLINLFFKVAISDVNCGLRGFKKESIEKLDLRCNGMEFASEMVAKAGQKKLKIKEVPINYYPAPTDRTPNLQSFSDGWRHLRFMLVLSPGYLFFLPGLVIFLLGFFSTISLLFKTVVVFNLPLGLSTVIFASACLLIGIQIILFGICAIMLNSSEGLAEENRIGRFLRKNFTLERGLIIGGITFGVGVLMGLTTVVFFLKFALNLPSVNLPLTKFAIASVFIALLGIQIIFSSFYISLLDIAKTLK